MAANEERGEFELTLGTKGFVLVPSFKAIQAFEKETGLSAIQLQDAASSGGMTLGQAAVVATHCINAGAANEMGKVSAEKIAEMIYETDGGLFAASKRLGNMLLVAVTGGYTAAGERKPRPQKAK